MTLIIAGNGFIAADRRESRGSEALDDICKVRKGKNFVMACAGRSAECDAFWTIAKKAKVKENIEGMTDLRRRVLDYIKAHHLGSDSKSNVHALIVTKKSIWLLDCHGCVTEYEKSKGKRVALGTGEEIANYMLETGKTVDETFQVINKKYPTAVSAEYDIAHI